MKHTFRDLRVLFLIGVSVKIAYELGKKVEQNRHSKQLADVVSQFTNLNIKQRDKEMHNAQHRH